MKKVILVLALVLGFSLFFACNSTPDAAVDPEPAAVEEVVEEVVEEFFDDDATDAGADEEEAAD